MNAKLKNVKLSFSIDFYEINKLHHATKEPEKIWFMMAIGPSYVLHTFNRRGSGITKIKMTKRKIFVSRRKSQ